MVVVVVVVVMVVVDPAMVLTPVLSARLELVLPLLTLVLVPMSSAAVLAVRPMVQETAT